MALGFLAGLHDQGVRVPADLALVGFDNRKASAWCLPALTTVLQPNWQVGKAGAEILLAKAAHEAAPAGGWSRTLQTRLVLLDSV